MSASPESDRNLLFAILALQMNFIERDALIAALNDWARDKSRPLADILRERGDLSAPQHRGLEDLVALHLETHGGDPQRSLETLSSAPSIRDAIVVGKGRDLLDTLTRIVESGCGDTTNGPRVSPVSNGPRYRILRQHARGGLGEVFVAEDIELHREVALKEIQPRRADDPTSRARFMLEAEVTGGLEHPGIVPVYGLGIYSDGRPYYAMRLIRGDSLKQSIERYHNSGTRGTAERRLAFRSLLRRFCDVCNAIGYAHSRGVLHRDIKPANVMLGKFGETLVVDWGLAKVGVGKGTLTESATSEEAALCPASGSQIDVTQAGSAVGTPHFMSPEQAAGRLDLQGPATDVYGLGATLYTLIAGRKPFDDVDPDHVLARVQTGQLTPPRRLCPDVPRALEAVCLKAMALRPADRYVTALELAADVEHWLADEPVSAYPEPLPARAARWTRRHRTAVAVAGVILCCAVVALAVTTALVLREQRETVRQKTIAQDNLVLARDLSSLGVDLIIDAEPEFAAVPVLDAARQGILKKAAGAFRRQLAESPDDLDLRQRTATVCRYAANVHRLTNETDAADQLYRESIRLYEELSEQFPEESIQLDRQAAALRDHANLKVRLGQLREADELLARSLEISTRLREREPEQFAHRRSHAMAALDRASVDMLRGKNEDAARNTATALEQFRALLTAPDEQRHAYDRLLLAAALSQQAGQARRADRLDDAMIAHVEANKLLDQMAVAPTNRVNPADLAHMRALCRLDQCLTRERMPMKRDIAEKNLTLLIVQWTNLAELFPRIPTYREMRATAILQRGQLRRDLGQLAEARIDIEAARTQLEPLVAAFPQIPNPRAELGRAYLRLGQLARSNQDGKAADEAMARACELLQQAVNASPDNVEYQRTLQEAQGK